MTVRKVFYAFVCLTAFSFLLMGSVFAENVEFVDNDIQMDAEDTLDGNFDVEGAESESVEYESCGFDMPEEKRYDGEVVAVRRRLIVDPGEAFRVKVFIKNTGNVPVFSGESVCFGEKLYLGTDKVRDRNSSLYDAELQGWVSPNRIMMDQKRVNPGEIASFTFWSIAPEQTDILKEYFTPVVDGVSWLDDAQISFELAFGNANMHTPEARKRLNYSNKSGSVMDIPIDGEKVILVDRGAQKAYAMIGDYVVREFPISSGAPSTPTPLGETKIELKQKIRVGVKPPHYIMPNFMWFRAGGFGFHSLPSLGKPNSGVFWTEAISHIGIPVSHGCIRLLPDDSDWLYNDFAEIGTKVKIVQHVSADMLPEGYM